MIAKPIIHITNWPSKKLHGPGKKWTMMALPREWEKGDGSIDELVPTEEDTINAKSGKITFDEFRMNYFAELSSMSLFRLGRLQAITENDTKVYVKSGDTICCVCSKDAASEGKCHRVFAAEIMNDAGWHVILDGKDFTKTDGK